MAGEYSLGVVPVRGFEDVISRIAEDARRELTHADLVFDEQP